MSGVLDWLLSHLAPGPPLSELDKRLGESEQRSAEARRKAEAAIFEDESRRQRIHADSAATRARRLVQGQHE